VADRVRQKSAAGLVPPKTDDHDRLYRVEIGPPCNVREAALEKFFLTSGRLIHPTPLPKTHPRLRFRFAPGRESMLFMAKETFSH
jgi:hypothetical protein